MTKLKHKPMLVTFTRTGERRYMVQATLDGERSVQMVHAPGYDPLMPHDLQHFIVEKCLRIEGGIFGRLAAGGTARTFHAITDGRSSRETSRLRRKQAARDKNILPAQTDDYMRSERATSICWYDWLRHSADPVLRLRADGMRESSTGMQARLSPAERADFTPQKLAEIRREFDRLSERWSSLAIGESFSEPW
jgi:hypothetical protein